MTACTVKKTGPSKAFNTKLRKHDVTMSDIESSMCQYVSQPKQMFEWFDGTDWRPWTEPGLLRGVKYRRIK